LEITLGNFATRLDGVVAVCGAEAPVTLDGREVPMWQAHEGRELAIGAARGPASASTSPHRRHRRGHPSDILDNGHPATLTHADLWKLGQLRPVGDTVRFRQEDDRVVLAHLVPDSLLEVVA
jgi:allophanate hydrolase subunit 2